MEERKEVTIVCVCKSVAVRWKVSQACVDGWKKEKGSGAKATFKYPTELEFRAVATGATPIFGATPPRSRPYFFTCQTVAFPLINKYTQTSSIYSIRAKKWWSDHRGGKSICAADGMLLLSKAGWTVREIT
jgi:hypothetical protein